MAEYGYWNKNDEVLVSMGAVFRNKKIRLSVNEKNNIAMKLYRKVGFKKEGVFRQDVKIGHRYFDTIEMARFVR